MHINPPRGSLTAITAIYDTIQYIKLEIQTVCLGQAASAATVLLAGGPPGKRLILPNAHVLIHQPTTQDAQGQATDLVIIAEEIDRMRVWLEEILSRRFGCILEQMHEDTDRDKVLTAAQTREYDLIDQVFLPRKGSNN